MITPQDGTVEFPASDRSEDIDRFSLSGRKIVRALSQDPVQQTPHRFVEVFC